MQIYSNLQINGRKNSLAAKKLFILFQFCNLSAGNGYLTSKKLYTSTEKLAENTKLEDVKVEVVESFSIHQPCQENLAELRSKGMQMGGLVQAIIWGVMKQQ